MTSFVPESLKALPEPVQSGLVGATLGAGAGYMAGDGLMMQFAIGYGALSAASAYAAPMVTADPMLQYIAAGGLGAAAMFASSNIQGLAFAHDLVHSAGIPAASLYIARSFM